jgi:hypothetical protein
VADVTKLKSEVELLGPGSRRMGAVQRKGACLAAGAGDARAELRSDAQLIA